MQGKCTWISRTLYIYYLSYINIVWYSYGVILQQSPTLGKSIGPFDCLYIMYSTNNDLIEEVYYITNNFTTYIYHMSHIPVIMDEMFFS